MKIIVSFTTFDKRKNYILPVLECMINQTYKPDEIRIYTEVDINDFNDKVRTYIEKNNIKVLQANGDEKGYKKLYPAIYDFIDDPETYIVTIDDDWKYRKTLIEELIECYKKHPNCIITERSKKIDLNLPYMKWKICHKTDPKCPFESLIYSGSGTLFKPCLFDKNKIFDTSYKTICEYADDIWWTLQAIYNNIPIISMTSNGHNIHDSINIPDNFTLFSINYTLNDTQFKDTLKYFETKDKNMRLKITNKLI